MKLWPFILPVFFCMGCHAGWVENDSWYKYESDPVALTSCVLRTGSVMNGDLTLNFKPWGTRTFSLTRTNVANLELGLEYWVGLDPFLRPTLTLQAGRMDTSNRQSVTNIITYGVDEVMETLSGTLYLNGLILRDGVYRGNGAGLSNLVERDPYWEAARTGGTTFGGEVHLPMLTVTDSGIRRSTGNATLSLMGGDAWNTGAMLELGGDGLAGSDVQNGGGQILLKDNTSRFRIRDREGWSDIADFRGDGSSYFDGPLTVRSDLIVANGGRVVVAGKTLQPKAYTAKGTIALYSTIPTNGIAGVTLADMPPWAKTVTRVSGRLGFATNYPQDAVTNIHFHMGQYLFNSPLTLTNQQYIFSLQTNHDAGVLTGILSATPLRQYVFDVPASITLSNYLNMSWYGYFHNASSNAVLPMGGYYWEYWIEMTE
ncbi:MAG TPA: hypothetical protein DCZ95_14985 [Verrucomicrobia bacterium]|nr:MAG: hypothetical protein A2X46_15545 [Lentisphaerae bacterium GWF2_57_35]HBA85390.1 hypothetical protein [Verrucomicrobiota bacterium]